MTNNQSNDVRGRIMSIEYKSLSILNSPKARLMIYGLLAVYAAVVIGNIFVNELQWDFRTYYLAARMYSEGGNPYDTGRLAEEAAGADIDPYVYPPQTLLFFKPFAMLGYQAAYFTYLVLKIIALAALVWIWARFFLADRRWTILLLIFCLFAFHEAVVRDLRAGNITIFEQLFIWTAMLFLVRKKPVLFCLLILITAQFKLAALILLPLPVILDRDRFSFFTFIAAGAAALLINLGVYYLSPGLFTDFISNAVYVAESHNTAPSVMVFINRAIKSLGLEIDNLGKAIYALYLIVLCAGTYLLVKRYDFKHHRLGFVMLSLLVYALLLPRFKVYSYVLVIVPALYVVRRAVPGRLLKALTVILVCVSLFPYQQWLLVAAMYAVLVSHFNRECKKLSHKQIDV